MNRTLFALLTLLILAIAAVAGKMWIDAANRTAPVAPLIPEHLVETRQTIETAGPETTDRDAFTTMPLPSEMAQAQAEGSEAAAKRKAEADARKKLETRKSL